jgi:hypothetical protein
VARWAQTDTEEIMSDFDKPMGTCCCVPPAPGLRLLTFLDGTQSGVFGLDEAFAAVYAEGGQVHPETAEEIITRLEAKKNYIPSSDHAHKEFRYVLLKEYRKYVRDRADKTTDRETTQ